MKTAIVTLALSMFLLGASLTYVSAGGGFTCYGTIKKVRMDTPIGIAPEGFRVYTANGDDGTVSVIDTTTNTVIATVTVTAAVSSNDPVGVAVHPDGNTVYVTNIDDDTVTVIDTATNTEVITIPVGNGPWSVGRFIWRP